MLAELNQRGVEVSYYVRWHFLDHTELSFKKEPARQLDRADVARRRRQWKAHQGKVAAARLKFVDETWVKTNMTRTHGRCANGQRLIAKVPHGRRETLTFIAALRCDGLPAACLLGGPIGADSFLA
jgi:hypothetical protein